MQKGAEKRAIGSVIGTALVSFAKDRVGQKLIPQETVCEPKLLVTMKKKKGVIKFWRLGRVV